MANRRLIPVFKGEMFLTLAENIRKGDTVCLTGSGAAHCFRLVSSEPVIYSQSGSFEDRRVEFNVNQPGQPDSSPVGKWSIEHGRNVLIFVGEC